MGRSILLRIIENDYGGEEMVEIWQLFPNDLGNVISLMLDFGIWERKGYMPSKEIVSTCYASA